MAPNAKQKLSMAKRRERVAYMYLRGKTVRQTAEVIGCSSTTVHCDIETLKLQWKETMLRDMGSMVAIELKKIAVIYVEAWDAWIRSTGDKTIEKTKLVESVEKGDVKSIERLVEKQAGNPTFLAVMPKCS